MLRLQVLGLALLALSFSAPAPAFAQAAPPDPFAPAADELAPPAPGVEAPPADEPAPTDQPRQPANTPVVVVVQAPAGYQAAAAPAPAYPQPVAPAQPMVPQAPPLPPRGSGAIWAEIGGGLLGAGVGIGATYAILGGDPNFGDAILALTMGPIITFWAVDLGIYFGGKLTGGQSSFGWTLLGTAAGAGIGTLIGFQGVFANSNGSDAALWGSAAISFAFAIAGGTAFFEWGDSRTRRRRAQQGGYALVPYVAPTRGGATFGLGATF